MIAERTTAPPAAPSTTVAPVTPLQSAVPPRVCATIDATVTAAMWPVLPSATPATSVHVLRWRSSSRRAAGTVAVSDIVPR